MKVLIEVISSVDFWKIVLPAMTAIIAWFLSERSKLKWVQHKQKEESYRDLLSCLKGFYVGAQEIELKNQFLYQLNLLWLYAPDNVIKAAYDFLNKVKTGVSYSDIEKELACAFLVETIRKDILKRSIVKNTTLNAKDFQLLSST